MKPSCSIKPITPNGHPSTKEQLVEWCNNLAKNQGVFNPDMKKGPVYECTMDNFGE